MIDLENQMIEVLSELKQKYYVTAIKAEFEAEGTRLDEAMRLKNIISKVGLGLNIKVGGCEAIKDMLDAISLGAERIIGPMIETPYALRKFLQAVKLVYGERGNTVEFLANIETITAYNNFKEMLSIPEISLLNGIVIGRVDFTGSLGKSRDSINGEEMLNYCLPLAKQAKAAGLSVVIGGGISADSLPFIRAFPEGHLDRFETRKVIFQCPGAVKNSEAAFVKAVEFELLWLKYKQAHYAAIAKEDQERINMLEKRYGQAMKKTDTI